jgi:hypothetical protein
MDLLESRMSDYIAARKSSIAEESPQMVIFGLLIKESWFAINVNNTICYGNE